MKLVLSKGCCGPSGPTLIASEDLGGTSDSPIARREVKLDTSQQARTRSPSWGNPRVSGDLLGSSQLAFLFLVSGDKNPGPVMVAGI